jgi:DNA-binding MarR family transcriptional regulator
MPRKGGQRPLEPVGCLDRRLSRPAVGLVWQLIAQLGLGQPEPRRPERAEHGPRGRVQVRPDGGLRGVFVQAGQGLERHLLRQVLGVRPVAYPRQDEGVDALELFKGAGDGSAVHVPLPYNSLAREIHDRENLQAAKPIPYTRAVAEETDERNDWTDRLLSSWTAVEPWFEAGNYEVTARISRVALHIARHQTDVFARFGLNRGEVGVLSALRFARPSKQLSPTQLFKGLMISSAGITSRLDRLEKRGLVRRERHPNDRRGVLVELTAEGRRVLDEAVKANTNAERGLLATLEPGEARELAALLKKVLAGLEA